MPQGDCRQTQPANEESLTQFPAGEQKAGGIARVTSVRKRRAVMRNRQFQIAEQKIATAADVKRMRFASLALKIIGDLKVADNHRAGALGDCDPVANVIAVPVRNEDEIRFHLIGGDRRAWIAGEKRIDEERAFRRFDIPTRMSVPREFDCHLVLRQRICTDYIIKHIAHQVFDSVL